MICLASGEMVDAISVTFMDGIFYLYVGMV